MSIYEGDGQHMWLERYEKNPILSPHPKNEWESFVVCNPGVWRDNGTVYMLYRASGRDKEHKIYFGLATSKDGYHFNRVSDQPILSPSIDGYDAGCIEDPRIVKMNGTFYVTYAFRPFAPGRYWEKKGFAAETPFVKEKFFPKFARQNLTMSGLLISKDLRRFNRIGTMTSPELDDRDVILFPEKIGGKFVMLHRPSSWVGKKHGCEKPSIWIAFADDLLNWKEHHLLAEPKFVWEFKKIGGSTPPLKTQKGWLVLYHGVDIDNVYRAGAMLLDLKNPRRILARSPHFILEPEMDYEKRGLIKNVVFPTGNTVIDGKILVYYGAADSCIAVATAKLDDLVNEVSRYPVK